MHQDDEDLFDFSCCCRGAPGEEVLPPSQVVRAMAEAGESSEEEEMDFDPFATPTDPKKSPKIETWSSLGRLRPEDLDFSELTRGNQMLRITKIDRRGITFDQLKNLLVFLKRRCDERGNIRGWYDPKTGNQLHYRTITMRDVNFWVVKPVTEKRKCCYVEAIASDEQAQLPGWFIGHCWSEPFVDFVRRAMKHGTLGPGDAFWSCAFSTRMDLCNAMSGGPGPSVIDFGSLKNLRVALTDCETLQSAEVLLRGWPNVQNLTSLDLDISQSPMLRAVGDLGKGFSVLPSLVALRLCLKDCRALENLDHLCRSMAHLGDQLAVLELDIAGCSGLKHVGGGSSSANSPGGCCLPGLKALRALKVHASGCTRLESVDLVSKDMKCLGVVELNFQGCSSLSCLDALARPFGELMSVRSLKLDMELCSKLRTLGDLARNLEGLPVLAHLEINLSACSRLADSGRAEMQATMDRLGRRPNMDLSLVMTSDLPTPESMRVEVEQRTTRIQL
eukprot:TRINITY_DN32958_c0_g1_i1.p1 TRINITY_DN32958_c0_g1~~TRINITY_DN32958_c0_g1_i1.p1  ORF type:complete len:504 (+),score=73.88 TRINITY_DN32958_c0_g1_i1:122-1633(+)